MARFYASIKLFNCLKATATSKRQFTFYHSVPRNSWYSFYRPRKDERLSRPWSDPVVLSTEPLDWESSALTTRPLLHIRSQITIQSPIIMISWITFLIRSRIYIRSRIIIRCRVIDRSWNTAGSAIIIRSSSKSE